MYRRSYYVTAIFSNMTLPLFSILVPSIKMAMAKRRASIYCSIHTHVNWIKLVILMILENQTIWISKLLMTKNQISLYTELFPKICTIQGHLELWTWQTKCDLNSYHWNGIKYQSNTYQHSACVKNHIVSFD